MQPGTVPELEWRKQWSDDTFLLETTFTSFGSGTDLVGLENAAMAHMGRGDGVRCSGLGSDVVAEVKV